MYGMYVLHVCMVRIYGMYVSDRPDPTEIIAHLFANVEDFVSLWIIEYIWSEYIREYTSTYVSEYISECTSECTSEYVSEYISGYVSGYTNEYASEYIDE